MDVRETNSGRLPGNAAIASRPPRLVDADIRVDDFDESLKRARALVARLEEEPHANENTGTQEFALRDPDGYYVMISAFSVLELKGQPDVQN